MAIIPSSKYAGQITTGDAGWPLGKAKNIAVAGDGTGTPLEADWVNDIWGFLQALLADGGVSPSGSPDNATASQYLQGLKQIIADAQPIRWVGSVSCAPTTPVATTSWGPTPDSVSYDGLGLAVAWTTPPWEQESSNVMASFVAPATNSRDRHVTAGLNAGDDIFCHVWDTISDGEVDLDGSFEVINFLIVGTKI